MNDSVSVLLEVFAERVRQEEKWGTQNWPIGGSGMFTRTAMNAREACNIAAQEGTLTWRHILREEFWEAFAEDDSDPQSQRAELVQVAAVAVAMIECIDRKDRYRAVSAQAQVCSQFIGRSDDAPQAEDSRRDRAREAQEAGSEEASPAHPAQDVA